MSVCLVCGLGPLGGGIAVFCSEDCRQIYHEQHVVPLIRERERLAADHMDDMLADTDHLEDMIEADDRHPQYDEHGIRMDPE